MKAKINTKIMFDFSCVNEDIDEHYLRNNGEEYVEMLKEEMENYLREEITDEDLTILKVETEIEYLEDIPKECK